VKARRRLRRLVPDAELIRRRAAGEPLRQLAGDYGVAHTTLGRYFARPQVKKELAQARRQLRAEQAARTSEWRRLEPEVRGRANEQAALEREEHKRFQLAWAEHRSRWRPPRDQYEALLNEHEAPRRPPTRADEHNTFDVIAKRVVATGGGTQAVIDANELSTLKQLVEMIDPAILTQAFANDALQLTTAPARAQAATSTAPARPRRGADSTPGRRRTAPPARPRLPGQPHHPQPLLRPNRNQATAPTHPPAATRPAASPHGSPPLRPAAARQQPRRTTAQLTAHRNTPTAPIPQAVAFPPKRDSDPFCRASKKGRQRSMAGKMRMSPPASRRHARGAQADCEYQWAATSRAPAPSSRNVETSPGSGKIATNFVSHPNL
jgi:hypothetical protein